MCRCHRCRLSIRLKKKNIQHLSFGRLTLVAIEIDHRRKMKFLSDKKMIFNVQQNAHYKTKLQRVLEMCEQPIGLTFSHLHLDSNVRSDEERTNDRKRNPFEGVEHVAK